MKTRFVVMKIVDDEKPDGPLADDDIKEHLEREFLAGVEAHVLSITEVELSPVPIKKITVEERLKEYMSDSNDEDFPMGKRDMRRQLVIEWAVQAADEIVLEGSDGRVEETDYLTAQVAWSFCEKIFGRVQSQLMASDAAIAHQNRKNSSLR